MRIIIKTSNSRLLQLIFQVCGGVCVFKLFVDAAFTMEMVVLH